MYIRIMYERSDNMSYGNNSLFGNILYYILVALAIILIFASTVFLLNVVGVIALIVLIIYGVKKLVDFIKGTYYKTTKKTPKGQWEKVNNNSEENSKEKVIIDVDYRDVK